MFCPMCGAKVNDDARFCTECGTPLAGLKPGTDAEAPEVPEGIESNDVESADLDDAAAPEPSLTPAPQQPKRSSMMSFLMERRQLGNRLVPTFAIIIASIIATIGIAYAAFMVYKNVIEPSMQQPTKQEQPAKKTKKKVTKKEPKQEEREDDSTEEQTQQQPQQSTQNEQAHAAYNEVLDQYREAFAMGGVDNYESSDASSDDGQLSYSTNNQWRGKFPFVNNMVGTSSGMYSSGTDGSNSKYLFVDLNGDGIDELLMANDYFVYSAYGYVDGQVKTLLTGWERNSYQLLSGGLLRCNASGGWATNVATVIKCGPDGSFETVDEVDEDIDGDQIVTKRVKDGQTLSEVTDPASGNAENGSALFDQLKSDYPEDTSAAWQSLN